MLNIFYLDISKFFISSNKYIYEYKYNENKIIEKNKIYVENELIKDAIYDYKNKRIYGFVNSNISIYCLKKKKRLCRFYNVNKIIINKYRYYHFPKKYFLMILQSLNFCIFSTKKHIKKCCSLLWDYKKKLNFKSKGIFGEKYIFTTETEFIMIDRNSFLVEIYDISDYIKNLNYDIIFDHFIYLITYSHEGNIVKFNYYQYNGLKFTLLFHHEVFLPRNNIMENIFFYSFQEYHFIYIKTNIENKLFFISFPGKVK